jgi:hypothetical protein
MSEVEAVPRKLASQPQFEGPVQWEEFLRFPGPLDGYIVSVVHPVGWRAHVPCNGRASFGTGTE